MVGPFSRGGYSAGRKYFALLDRLLDQGFGSICKSGLTMFALALPTFSLALYGPLLAVLAALALLATLGRVPIRYSLRNLIVRWRTTALTALAFMLVVGLMIVMLAFVTAMSRLTEQSGQPGN